MSSAAEGLARDPGREGSRAGGAPRAVEGHRAPIAKRLSREAGLLAVLALHAVVFLSIVLRGSRWATLSVDCVVGAVGESILGEPAWGPWSVIDGLVGGQVVYASVALPFYALLGTGGGVAGKLAAWLITVSLLCIVHAIGTRAAGRLAGTLAAAGVAFAPPLAFASSMAAGNWHWSELVFDHGVALLALAVAWPATARPERYGPRAGLLLLGLLSGLAIFNSPQSLPFVLLAWLVAALGCGARRFLLGLPSSLLGGALGLAIPIWRVLQMGGKGGGPGKGDVPWARLLQFDVDFDKLLDLGWSRLPLTLHLPEALPFLGARASGALEVAWVVACWTGCLLALASVLDRLRKGERGGHLVATLLPLLFCAAFAAAYLAIQVRIGVPVPHFSEYRNYSHRVFPPLLVAMAAGAAPGWAWVYWRLGGVRSRSLAAALRVLVLAAALAAPGIGLLSEVTVAAQAPGRGDAGLALYRGSCFDPSGFFMAGRGVDRRVAESRCRSLGTPERQTECIFGVSQGLGFMAARLEGPGDWPKDRGDDPCEHTPPDFAARCESWEPGATPSLGAGLEEVCRSVGDEMRGACFMGAGWFVSQVAWGGALWPIDACDSLADEMDRESCWHGAGFQLGDHMGNTPERIGPLLDLVPAGRRSAVAHGVGFVQGAMWEAEHIAHGTCESLDPEHVPACRAGVAEARAWAHPGSQPR